MLASVAQVGETMVMSTDLVAQTNVDGVDHSDWSGAHEACNGD